MTFKHILASGLISLPLLATARPATPDLITYTNPDGSRVEVRAYGDEHFSYITDADYRVIYEQTSSGALKPAVRSGRTLTTSAADINLLRAEKVAVPSLQLSGSHRMAELDKEGRSTYPTKGDVHGLVILLEYPDRPFTVNDPKQAFSDLCNKEGYDAYGGKGSARDYYIAASGGQFRPTFDVYGPVKLAHEAAYYTGLDDPTLRGSGKTGRFGVAVEEAVKALDSQINFKDYDLDNDGVIDNIFFFYSGKGQADTLDPTCVWPHQGNYMYFTKAYANSPKLDDLYADGVQMRTYACSNELNGKTSTDTRPYLDGIGAFVHEYGHVLGLPDIYDTGDRGACKTPDYLTVMDKGSYNENSTRPPLFSAYEKWVCNWLDYTDAEAGETYTLPSLSKGEDAKAVRIRIRQPGGGVRYYNEYYVLESRTAEGWDTSLGEDGLLIWHINYSNDVWVSNQVNSGYNANVEVITPDEDFDMHMWPGIDNAYPYLIPTMEQALKPYVNSKSFEVWLSNISYDPEAGATTFEYNKHTELPDVTTVLHDDPTAQSILRTVYLYWDAVPEASEYRLTVTYTNAAGKESYYAGYNDRSTGLNHGAALNSIPESLWNTEFTAYVRTCTYYPSSAISNTITFTPSQLAEGSGVESVGSDSAASIYGTNGAIVAPEGSRAYNLSGVETGLENLPAGIYIVVSNGKTVKVAVK